MILMTIVRFALDQICRTGYGFWVVQRGLEIEIHQYMGFPEAIEDSAALPPFLRAQKGRARGQVGPGAQYPAVSR